jgi:hypothetical protein
LDYWGKFRSADGGPLGSLMAIHPWLFSRRFTPFLGRSSPFPLSRFFALRFSQKFPAFPRQNIANQREFITLSAQ